MEIKGFYDDLKEAEKVEKEFAKILKSKGARCFKVPHTSYGYDIRAVLPDGSIKTYEIKSLAGVDVRGNIMKTGCVEVWSDDKRTKRPHWWAMGDTDYIVFKNRLENTFYIYDAKALISSLEDYIGEEVRAGTSNKDDSGWLAKFYWKGSESEGFLHKTYILDGFLGTYKGLAEGN